MHTPFCRCTKTDIYHDRDTYDVIHYRLLPAIDSYHHVRLLGDLVSLCGWSSPES